MEKIPGTNVNVLTDEESREMVETLTRKSLDMSLDEFLEAWDSGAFENTDTPEIMHIAMLLPFVRNGR